MKQAVVGIVLNRKKQQLLAIKRRDVPIWTFVSGGVDPGESVEKAVIREIEEETGIQTRITRKVAEFTPVCKLTTLTHVFECEPVSGDLQTSDETIHVGYYPIQSPPSPFFELHEIWLNLTLENRLEILERPLTEVTYWSVFLYFLKHPIQVIRIILSRFGFPINRRS